MLCGPASHSLSLGQMQCFARLLLATDVGVLAVECCSRIVFHVSSQICDAEPGQACRLCELWVLFESGVLVTSAVWNGIGIVCWAVCVWL